MLAFRSSKITIACGEDFLYELNADPAGGSLRRPSSAGRLPTAVTRMLQSAVYFVSV
jgi:hypothetical protein